jgi:hypothetical protein
VFREAARLLQGSHEAIGSGIQTPRSEQALSPVLAQAAFGVATHRLVLDKVTQTYHNLTLNCHNLTLNCHNLTRNCNQSIVASRFPPKITSQSFANRLVFL